MIQEPAFTTKCATLFTDPDVDVGNECAVVFRNPKSLENDKIAALSDDLSKSPAFKNNADDLFTSLSEYSGNLRRYTKTLEVGNETSAPSGP